MRFVSCAALLLAHAASVSAQTAYCGNKRGDGTGAISDSDCGAGYIYNSYFSSYQCAATPCVTGTYGAADQFRCCTDDPAAITPFACNESPVNQGPLVLAKDSSGYILYRVNRYTGAYSPVYTIAYSATSPAISTIGACGLNPVDKIIYCMIQLTGYSNDEAYIVRLDSTRVEYLYKIIGMTGQGGTVDYEGTFLWYRSYTFTHASGAASTSGQTIQTPQRELHSIANIHGATGHAAAASAVDYTGDVNPALAGDYNSPAGTSNQANLAACLGDCGTCGSDGHGGTLTCFERGGSSTAAIAGCTGSGVAGRDYCYDPTASPKYLTQLVDLDSFSATVLEIYDLVPVTSDLDGSGNTVRYVLGLGSSHLMVVKYSGQTYYQSWYLAVSMIDGSAVPTGIKGAGWMYDDHAFWGLADGSGVYEVDLTTLSLSGSLTATLKRVSELDVLSGIASNYDGLNCPGALDGGHGTAAIPFATCGDKNGPTKDPSPSNPVAPTDCGTVGYTYNAFHASTVCQKTSMSESADCSTAGPDRSPCCQCASGYVAGSGGVCTYDCSSQTCNGRGVASTNAANTGCDCTCNSGYTGVQCLYTCSNANACHGYGVGSSGFTGCVCNCYSFYRGASCEQCADGYFGWPNCQLGTITTTTTVTTVPQQQNTPTYNGGPANNFAYLSTSSTPPPKISVISTDAPTTEGSSSSVSTSCACNGLTGATNNGGSACTTMFQGRPYCYTNVNACTDGVATVQVSNSEWSFNACGVLETIVSVSTCPYYAPVCGNTVLPAGSAVGNMCTIACIVDNTSPSGARWCPTTNDHTGNPGTPWGWCAATSNYAPTTSNYAPAVVTASTPASGLTTSMSSNAGNAGGSNSNNGLGSSSSSTPGPTTLNPTREPQRAGMYAAECDASCTRVAAGKLRELVLRYTGAHTFSHTQSNGQVNVIGDASNTPSVTIVATDQSNYWAFPAVTFTSWNIGDEFTLGLNPFPHTLQLSLTTSNGEQISVVQFSTSRTEPLLLGNIFGSIMVAGFRCTTGEMGSWATVQSDCGSSAGPETKLKYAGEQPAMEARDTRHGTSKAAKAVKHGNDNRKAAKAKHGKAAKAKHGKAAKAKDGKAAKAKDGKAAKAKDGKAAKTAKQLKATKTHTNTWSAKTGSDTSSNLDSTGSSPLKLSAGKRSRNDLKYGKTDGHIPVILLMVAAAVIVGAVVLVKPRIELVWADQQDDGEVVEFLVGSGEKETSRTSGRDAQMLEVNESEPLLSSSKNGAVPAGANSAEGSTYGGVS